MKFVTLCMCSCVLSGLAVEIQSPKVQPGLPDAAQILPAYAAHIEGWLGARMAANVTNRLLTVDTEPLLAGFKKKPGTHPWIGEHVGKWLHAATLAWATTGDQRLRTKLDAVAAELIAAQEADGYLGTYIPEQRFGLFPNADWDVWSHKYNLIGLLTYYEYTGNQPALDACKKMGDLLLRTFGPEKKSILSAGTHMGMASTSVLEPMVILYRHTGDRRYLDFCQYLVKSWDEPGGPKVLQSLLTQKQVNQTANGKAYEMLSNLVGLCELARATGDRQLLTPILNAWQDIVKNQLYITGSASQGEHFREDHSLPNGTGAHIAETCVTTTWIQLNLQLLRLTGDARFGTELERTLYNHLAAAQRPRGDDWCYYTPLEGKKPYESAINCCHSSGPRGMALAAQQAYFVVTAPRREALLVNTFETSEAHFTLGEAEITVHQASEFPIGNNARVTFKSSRPAKFALGIRVPVWSSTLAVMVNGTVQRTETRNGWAMLPARDWQPTDVVQITFELKCEMVAGEYGNAGLAALRWGPFVLAYDSSAQKGLPAPSLIGFADRVPAKLQNASLRFSQAARSPRLKEPAQAVFVPFADAGAEGGTYRVWIPAPETELRDNPSLLAGAQESRSREGNVDGSIIDGDPATFVVTFDNRKAKEDSYTVTLDEPIRVRRVEFTHGKVFHDGGWFDTSESMPRVLVQKQHGGSWEQIGTLDDYPATTSTDTGPLGSTAIQKFSLKLKEPIAVWGLRVAGTPACGDNPQQAFSSCGELQAYPD
jgi:hypothetical protein